jgi:hypothetical protein
MASNDNVIYVAIDGDIPFLCAPSFDSLKKALDEYYAVHRNEGECLGFFPYKYPDSYEGYYNYKFRMILHGKVEEYIDTIKIYCVTNHGS